MANGMTKGLTPAEIAVMFIDAFGRREMDTLAGLFAQDVVFDSPRVTVRGAGAVLEVVDQFAQVVTGVEIVAALGDDKEAMIMYDMETVPFGVMRAVDRLVIHEGKIVSDALVFDTYEVRRAAEG